MKIKPILTEKSMNLAKKGKYSFWVDPSMRKPEIIKLINGLFGVHVKEVSSANYKRKVERSLFRKGLKVKPARKKAVVTLSPKEKIEIFEGGKEK